MLRKFDKKQPESDSGPPDPLDHRVLSIYSAVYRVEAGAWVRLFIPWLMKWIPAASYGGLPGPHILGAQSARAKTVCWQLTHAGGRATTAKTGRAFEVAATTGSDLSLP